MSRRRDALKLAFLTAALGLVALCLVALACAPAGQNRAPASEGEATLTPTPTIWILDDTSPSELATAMAAPSATALPDDFVWPTARPLLTIEDVGATLAANIATPTPTIWWLGDTPSPAELATLEAIPTATPYPPGYIYPTDPPYIPPLANAQIGATLAANIATAQAQQASEAAAETPTPEPTPTPTPLPLTEQVTQFAREMQGRYDIVARVRAGDTRHIKVSRSVAWPPYQEPVFSNWDGLMRTPITAVTTYYGDLPAGYELISPPRSLYPNVYLDSGAEYVIFIWKSFVKASDYPDAPNDKFLYNQTQLDAIGGEGGGRFGLQAWVVDGSTAWRIPGEHIRSRQPAADLAVARAAGERLLLSELEAAIRRGLPQ